MKNRTWQRTVLEWRNRGQQEPDWKINIPNSKPIYKGEEYWMKKLKAVQAPNRYAVVSFDILKITCAEDQDKILERVQTLSCGRWVLEASSDREFSFQVVFRLRGAFCDEVFDFAKELFRVLGIDPFWLGDFGTTTQTYYLHSAGGENRYIPHDQWFRIKKGVFPKSEILVYREIPSLNPLS